MWRAALHTLAPSSSSSPFLPNPHRTVPNLTNGPVTHDAVDGERDTNTTCPSSSSINDSYRNTNTNTNSNSVANPSGATTGIESSTHKIIHSNNNGINYTIDVAQDLQVRLWSDAAVLWTFGVMFPPLMLLICWSMLVDLAAAQWAIGSLLRFQCALEERLAYYTKVKSTFIRNTSEQDGFDANIVNNNTEATNNHSNNQNDQVDRMTVLLQEDVTCVHTVLVHLNHRFRRFGRLYRSASCCLLVLGTCFWSLTLFDVLGDTSNISHTNTNTNTSTSSNEDNVLAAVWLVILMASAPLWLYLVAKYTMVLGRLIYVQVWDESNAAHRQQRTSASAMASSPGNDATPSPMSCRTEEKDIEMTTFPMSSADAVKEVSSMEQSQGIGDDDANNESTGDVEVRIVYLMPLCL